MISALAEGFSDWEITWRIWLHLWIGLIKELWFVIDWSRKLRVWEYEIEQFSFIKYYKDNIGPLYNAYLNSVG